MTQKMKKIVVNSVLFIGLALFCFAVLLFCSEVLHIDMFSSVFK